MRIQAHLLQTGCRSLAGRLSPILRLLGCSLTPQASHLTPAPGCLVLARRAAQDLPSVRKPPDCVFLNRIDDCRVMIVEVEEVGRVVYTVRGLSSTNHQSPHAEHFLVQNGCSSAVISVHQRSGIFGSYPGTVPAVFSILPQASCRRVARKRITAIRAT